MFLNKLILSVITFLFIHPLHAENFKYSVGICAIFQNEARFMKEWIEFHQMLGVDHFYLYNNRSTDQFQEILEPYIKNGLVELFDWPYSPSAQLHWSTIQTNAYIHAVELAKGKCNWLAAIDLDEFIVLVKENSLPRFLSQYETVLNNRTGAVCINWQMYGTSGVAHIPDHKLSIEVLLMKAPDKFHENLHVKSIVHPHCVKDCKDAHYFILKKGFKQINPDFTPFNKAISPLICIDKIRLNHYWTRDEEYLWKNKMARRTEWKEAGASVEARAKTLNTVEDPIILRFVPKLRKQMNLD